MDGFVESVPFLDRWPGGVHGRGLALPVGEGYARGEKR